MDAIKKIVFYVGALCLLNTAMVFPSSLYDSSTPPGGELFTLVGQAGTTDVHTVFGWMLPVAGNGLIQFKANAANDIWIVVASSAAYEAEKCVAVGIGVDNNTKSVIKTTLDADNKVTKGDSISPGMIGVSDSWGDYWVMVRNGKIMYGKGTTPDKNIILQWSSDLIGTVQFVGFGCKGDTLVEFDKIKISEAVPELSIPDSPAVEPKAAKKEIKQQQAKVYQTSVDRRGSDIKAEDAKVLPPVEEKQRVAVERQKAIQKQQKKMKKTLKE
jgi:hypothetical protein